MAEKRPSRSPGTERGLPSELVEVAEMRASPPRERAMPMYLRGGMA
jgi:hypothetical protein